MNADEAGRARQAPFTEATAAANQEQPRQSDTEARGIKDVLRANGLSIALALLFFTCVAAQIAAGRASINEQLHEKGFPSLTVAAYLKSGHFLEALFENWESEFLQMGVFVLLTARLFQRGSSESKQLSGDNECDEDPRSRSGEQGVPWPVRRGGWVLKLYEHSLSAAFLLLFLTTFALHALSGLWKVNEERLIQAEAPQSFAEYLRSAQFWYESFQNWQSEFLAVLAVVTFSIFLRERGSPQSKPVAARHDETSG